MKVILIVALIMLAIGTTAALIWWRLAESMFPGAGRSTGQVIGLRRQPRKPGGVVISGFEHSSPPTGEPPPQPPHPPAPDR